MATVMKSKLVAKDLGPPKAVTALPDGQEELVLGTIIGQANDVSTRTDQRTGEIYEGLKGFFEGNPADPKRDVIQAGICYLPGGFQEMVVAQLKEMDEETGERRNPIVSFAFTLATIKSSNAAGYSYKLTPLMEISKGDPLEALRAQIAGTAPARIAPPDREGEEPAPRRAAAGGKGKGKR